ISLEGSDGAIYSIAKTRLVSQSFDLSWVGHAEYGLAARLSRRLPDLTMVLFADFDPKKARSSRE
ncbi:MAG TPA: hypothetical protein VLU73_00150, partial [Methylococcaceae bacterium]|nr:hypothetical protein [Methylococcaceae bacterium]